MSESLIKVASLSLATLFKKGSGTRVFLLIFQNFLENIFSRPSLDNSVLKQLLALSFPVIYSWQLSSSEKSLVSKKLYPYISRILQICYTDFFFSFYLSNACLPCRLRKMYALLWPTNRFVVSEIPKNNTFDLIDSTCESLNCIANIFQETLNSLVLMDSLIICIYLR